VPYEYPNLFSLRFTPPPFLLPSGPSWSWIVPFSPHTFPYFLFHHKELPAVKQFFFNGLVFTETSMLPSLLFPPPLTRILAPMEPQPAINASFFFFLLFDPASECKNLVGTPFFSFLFLPPGAQPNTGNLTSGLCDKKATFFRSLSWPFCPKVCRTVGF